MKCLICPNMVAYIVGSTALELCSEHALQAFCLLSIEDESNPVLYDVIQGVILCTNTENVSATDAGRKS